MVEHDTIIIIIKLTVSPDEKRAGKSQAWLIDQQIGGNACCLAFTAFEEPVGTPVF